MEKTYTVIPDFLLDYDLSLTEIVALSVIYGFCQDGKSDFHGSYSYLARKCKMQRRSIVRLVSRLVEKGLLQKETREVSGVQFNSLKTMFGGGDRKSLPVTESHRGGDPVSLGGGDRKSPNNIYRENIEDNIGKKDIYISQEKFNFLSALKGLGVTEEVAQAWMEVRKTKRATNTRIAFDRVKAEIAKAGYAPDKCIRTAVENSWSGFKAEWMPAKREEIWHGSMDDYLKKLKQDGTLK